MFCWCFLRCVFWHPRIACVELRWHNASFEFFAVVRKAARTWRLRGIRNPVAVRAQDCKMYASRCNQGAGWLQEFATLRAAGCIMPKVCLDNFANLKCNKASSYAVVPLWLANNPPQNLTSVFSSPPLPRISMLSNESLMVKKCLRRMSHWVGNFV